jgi:hypothetical protein
MARHIFTILCESASIDSITNGLTLTKIIEGFGVSPEPQAGQTVMVPMSAMIVTVAMRDDSDVPESVPFRIDLVYPDGTSVAGPIAMLDLSSAPRTRNLMTVQGFGVKGLGDHKFVVYFGNNSDGEFTCVGEWIFAVMLPPSEAQRQPA